MIVRKIIVVIMQRQLTWVVFDIVRDSEGKLGARVVIAIQDIDQAVARLLSYSDRQDELSCLLDATKRIPGRPA